MMLTTTTPVPAALGSNQEGIDGSLGLSEIFWRDHQPWLESCGYMLRQRYKPEWKPSWQGTKKRFFECDDGLAISHPFVLDATRTADQTRVTLKRTSKKAHPHEQAIISYFSSDKSLAGNTRNHCVPVYETLQVPDDPDTIILVMPFLRLFNDPPFQTVGETIHFFDQIIEGVQFMHEHGVAHRDISSLNIMMDPRPMFPNLYHPIKTVMDDSLTKLVKPYTRTEHPTRYYFVDFGLSSKFPPKEIARAGDLPALGGYRTVPEFQGEGRDRPHNPFQTDIFYLGYLIQDCFLEEYINLDFVQSLVQEMTKNKPADRPTINVVAEQYANIRGRLGKSILRRPLVRRQDSAIKRTLMQIKQLFQNISYSIRGVPPVPS